MSNSLDEKKLLSDDGCQNGGDDVVVDIHSSHAGSSKPALCRPLSRQAVRKDIVFNDVCYTLPVKVKGKKVQKEILKNVSGILKPGLNAILGPTGSGKTSLLDVLAGRKDKRYLTGDVIVDGERQPEDFRLMSGYVVQEDIIMGTLTVEENLQFSADLRLPGSLSKQDRRERVAQVMDDLGLTSVASSKVGSEMRRGISGGEKKRAMVGMELMTSPDILFLDEPTTGLDASTAYSVMALLRKQADKGKTIVFSIHQPRYSIFRLFDSITLLSAGEVVYHGEGAKALEYFQHIGYECDMYNNPPDFILDVISYDIARNKLVENGESLEESIDYKCTGIKEVSPQSKQRSLANAYIESEIYENTSLEMKPIISSLHDVEMNDDVELKPRSVAKYESSFPRQFSIVAHRALVNILRNPQLLLSQSFVVAVFAVVVGIIYLQLDLGPSGLQNRVGVLLFLTMNVVFSNIGAVQVFLEEKPLFKHESASGYYRVSSYFISKALCDLIALRFVPTLMYACITYWMVGFVSNGLNFLVFALVIFFTAVCACSVAFFISASVRTYPVAQILMILPTIIMLVFSGVFVNLSTMPSWLNWLKYLSLFRYALSTLLINELKGMQFHNCGTDPKTHLPKPCISGDGYLAAQGINPDDKWVNVIAIAGIALFFLIAAYIQLRRLKKFK